LIASLLRYVLLEGSVALFALGALVSILPEDGHTEPPPPLFGECAVAKEALLGEECPRHALGARTLTAAKLLILPRAKFPQLLHLLPDLKGDGEALVACLRGEALRAVGEKLAIPVVEIA
jgi:hypothetical protein